LVWDAACLVARSCGPLPRYAFLEGGLPHSIEAVLAGREVPGGGRPPSLLVYQRWLELWSAPPRPRLEFRDETCARIP
jgi:hypothetical protein